MEMGAERVIDRPASEVAEFFFDAENNPSWQSGMKLCEWESDPPIAVGSTYRQEASFLGRPVVSRFEVTEYTPGASMTIETIESTFPITVTRRVEAIGESSCRVSARIAGGPRGVLGLAAPLMRPIAQRSIDRDYDRLVEVLSARG